MGSNIDTVFDLFYDSLSKLKESKQQNPEAALRVVHDGGDIAQMLAELDTLEIPFSGEECFGRYLDLHRLYNMYVNSEFGHSLKYTDFLTKFPAVDCMISSRFKGRREYREYVREVYEYLVSFMERAHPLVFLDRVFKKLESEFEEGSLRKRRCRTGISVSFDGFEIDEYDTVEGLMELGLEKLKEVLDCLGLKSGGTLRQRAERVLVAKNTPVVELDRKHFKRGDTEEVKETVILEAKVKKLCEMLNDTLERTREYVVNKQAMTRKEIDDDLRNHKDFKLDDEESDGNGDGEVYNPLKLPIGLDGRPIPYWLYKLHGLGQKFECEICGNYTYSGRREFEMHFKQARHQHCMRCLGIPNTKSFSEITSIDAARKLWAEIEQRQSSSKWQPELYEEFEDSEGNVYNKKTYTDLSRQGLI